jgi:hypothetical protein
VATAREILWISKTLRCKSKLFGWPECTLPSQFCQVAASRHFAWTSRHPGYHLK